jgi:AcrR family transcriptional regulator
MSVDDINLTCDVSDCNRLMSGAAVRFLMARWEPDARGRLVQAAMDLYRERGYPNTTVAEIAARAGLTERTFFRYFTDKREVLFWGSGTLQELLVDKVVGAPGSAAPIDAVASALEATAPFFEERRAFARRRHALIAAHAELHERELIKLASLASAIAEALRRRGVRDPAASLVAETGIAIFKIAFEHWVKDAKQKDIAHHVRQSLGELKALTSGLTTGLSRTRS